MNSEKFNTIVDYRIEKIKEILQSKAQEYSSNDDRLHNFNLASKINNCTREQALWGMATKHLVSVIDMINSNKIPSQHMVDEKIGDMINYLILLEICFKEKIEEKNEYEKMVS